jgi:chromosome segregation protein
MNLRKLELFGFKSFMRKLDIHFSDGITVIVGPNGCGKTNVTDALRWVLGEGNARMLRGEKMEDLIFNGTRDYKPLNVAEVGLTVDNSAGILPIEFSEVTVSRRVFRNGESEFLINKVPCRLRDIHELFLDTGLGSRAYSVIEREMVEMVLGDQPEKRRELLEEAAGIMKYKIRERAAHRKLQATDEDLARINDILGEVERQVRSLKRKVGAARRYQEIRDRLRSLEIGLALVDVQAMRTDHHALEAAMEDRGRERDEALTKTSVLDAEVEELRRRAAETEGTFATIQRSVDDAVERAREEERLHWSRKEKRESLLENAKRLSQEREELDVSLKQGELRRTENQQIAGQQEAGLVLLLSNWEEMQNALLRMESDLEARRGELSRTRERAEAAAGEVLRVRTECANLDAHREHLADRDAVLAEEARVLEKTLELRQAECEESRSRLNGARDEMAAAERNLVMEGARREELDKSREDWREKVNKLALEIEAARSGLEMLRGLQESFEGFGAGARALLTKSGARVSALADALHVKTPDLVPALETALGQSIEALVVDGEGEAVGALQKLKEGAGRATILDRSAPRDGNGAESTSLPQDSAILGWARSFLDAPAEVSHHLDVLLSRVILVESLADAIRLSKRSGLRGHRFVTRDGDWAMYPGLVHGGSPKGSKDAGILGRGDRIAALTARLGSLDVEKNRAQEKVESMERDRAQASAGIRALESERDRIRTAHAGLEKQGERAEVELATAVSRLEAVRVERASLAARSAEIEETRSRVQEELRLREGERDELDGAWRVREQELVSSSADRDAGQRRCHDALLDIERRRNEIDKLQTEITRLVDEHRAAEEGIARRTEEIISAERAAAELAREIELGQERFAQTSRETEEKRRVRDDAARARAEILDQLRKIEEERGRWIRVRDHARDLVHEAEMKRTKIASSLEERVARMKREFGVDLEKPEAASAHVLFEGAAAEELDAARRERDDLDTQLSRMGLVNMVALEQFDRESRRFEFLSSQKQDLEAARESLRRTIRKINRTARTMFTETLEQVRVNFKRTYGTLFEGGQADVRLSGDEDPLLAAVEIYARPKGKQLSNISLLSSGERALTAVAFLFAIYLVKPSPFCILDEVDAPLDDANIGRFLSMLKNVAEKTQFVMITHNKKTMEVADTMYGVTMEEPGVSKLVSVRLGRGTEPEVVSVAMENGQERIEELVLEGSA